MSTENAITAIDIALEPDATMDRRAEIVNAQLRSTFPKGFALGPTHRPHISILQRYVRTADLGKVYDCTGKVLADANPADWKLKAFKYYYIPWNELGLAGIVVEPTTDLLKLQQSFIDAVAPYTEEIGTPAAFATTPEDPEINRWGRGLARWRVAPFPAPAHSNGACGFPALRSPVHFVPRVM